MSKIVLDEVKSFIDESKIVEYASSALFAPFFLLCCFLSSLLLLITSFFSEKMIVCGPKLMKKVNKNANNVMNYV